MDRISSIAVKVAGCGCGEVSGQGSFERVPLAPNKPQDWTNPSVPPVSSENLAGRFVDGVPGALEGSERVGAIAERVASSRLSAEKVPGVSDMRMQKWLASMRESVGTEATSAYDGANWVAKWRVASVNEYGVDKAELVSAHGGDDEITLSGIGYGERGMTPEVMKAASAAVSQALRGAKFQVLAKFSWRDDDIQFSLGKTMRDKYVPKVGDIFESSGDAFYRGFGPSDPVAERMVEVRVKRAAYKASADEIHAAAEFRTI